MRIGFDAKRALMNNTGLGVYARNLINSISNQYPDNDYFLFTPNIHEYLLEQIGGKFEMVLPSRKIDKILPALWRTFSAIRQIRDLRLDVFHGLSNELPFGIHKVKGLKKIVTIHDLIFLKEQSQYPLIDRIIYEQKVRYACKIADKIIAISYQTKRDLVKLMGADENKIEVIYQNYDEIFFDRASLEQKSLVQGKYSLPEKFILNVSAFFPRKNQLLLIKAFESAMNQIPHHLILVGGYEMERSEIEKYISENNIASRIQIISQIPKEDLAALYQIADLFVYPSRFEGFGIPILEAMASGTRVLANDVSCFREIGADAITYFAENNQQDLADEILSCLSNMQDNNDAMNQRLSLFTAEKFAKMTFEAYR